MSNPYTRKRERQEQAIGLAIVGAILAVLFMGCRSNSKFIRVISYMFLLGIVGGIIWLIYKGNNP